MAKKDNKSHHDKGVTLNFNRQEHSNSFIQRRDPRLNQQEIAEQNLALNSEEGNRHYKQVEQELEAKQQAFAEKKH